MDTVLFRRRSKDPPSSAELGCGISDHRITEHLELEGTHRITQCWGLTVLTWLCCLSLKLNIQ